MWRALLAFTMSWTSAQLHDSNYLASRSRSQKRLTRLCDKPLATLLHAAVDSVDDEVNVVRQFAVSEALTATCPVLPPATGPAAGSTSYCFRSSWTFGSLKFSFVTTCAGISTTLGSTFSPFSTLSIAYTPRYPIWNGSWTMSASM
jgi:hypothetical protein